ncbi:TPA_asm: RNA-directed RNA polymerase, partial [ssRNA phage Esthiorhiza.2_34]
MKSQADNLLHVLKGYLLDILLTYPEMRKHLERDLQRISLLTSNRGLGLYTLDLPALDSSLLEGLETGRLQLGGPHTRCVSRKCQVPKLFSGLWLRIFEANSCLKQEPDPSAIAFLRSILKLGNKLDVECSPNRRKAALEAYHEIESGLRLPSLNWGWDEILLDEPSESVSLTDCVEALTDADFFFKEEEEVAKGQSRLILDKIQQVADILSRELGDIDVYSEDFLADNTTQGIGFKHGPGAVASKVKNWDKSLFPLWSSKLEHVFPYQYCGITTLDIRSGARLPINHELSSRMLCVPKTAKSPRIIAAEPVEHQWCQQALWSWFRRSIKRTVIGKFIDFSRQDLSAAHVVQASRDRSLATVDLSDASDRLSCWTVERIFRSNHFFLNALHAARTRYLQHEDGSFLKLRKFASQGTAATFPVQSFVFLCIALGVSIKRNTVKMSDIRRCIGQVRVYGDDIILPVHGYEQLKIAMQALQLQINARKSFALGKFRESCGTDAYDGYDCTPVKPLTLTADGPLSRLTVVEAANNLFKKGYWHASNNCLDLLPSSYLQKLRVCGPRDSGMFGLTSYVGNYDLHLKKRWNRDYQRWDVRTVKIKSSTVKTVRQAPHSVLDFFSQRKPILGNRIASEYVKVSDPKERIGWEAA